MTEMYNPSPARLEMFWNSFQQLFIDLYGSRLSTVAAINGHAPAAGCMIALACDYRVMGDKAGVIGLNETTFGIVPPPWLAGLMIRTVGFRKGEMALSLGTLLQPHEAFEVGLVDKVVMQDDVFSASRRVVKEWAKIPSHARGACKSLTRKQYIDELVDTRNDDLDFFRNYIMNEKIQNGLGAYLQSLQKK